MKAKRKIIGRPRTGKAREHQIAVRVTPAERNELAAAAARDDRPLSYWLRKLGLDKARNAG